MQPILDIESALAAIRDRDDDLANLIATPIALLGQTLSTLEGVKGSKTEHFNPVEFRRRIKRAAEIIDPSTAQMFLDLNKNKKVPSWVLEFTDVELIRDAAANIPK